jgi:hypothetical protein
MSICLSAICCVKPKPTYKSAMTRSSLAITIATMVPIALTGCGLVRHVFHSSEPAPAQTTSDVTNPGRPLPPPSPTPAARTASRKSSQRTAGATPSSGATKTPPPASSAQFPVAKPVPGKPGLVFNPFKPNGGYIDVSGYAPGSKVKDPETQKIFVVPKPE